MGGEGHADSGSLPALTILPLSAVQGASEEYRMLPHTAILNHIPKSYASLEYLGTGLL